jgi:hypothetical protein
MYLGTAILIIFTVVMFMLPGRVWLTIFKRLAVIVALLAAIGFLYLKPMNGKQSIDIIERFTIPEMDANCHNASMRWHYGYDSCVEIENQKRKVQELKKGLFW